MAMWDDLDASGSSLNQEALQLLSSSLAALRRLRALELRGICTIPEGVGSLHNLQRLRCVWRRPSCRLPSHMYKLHT